jgi:hypothetical protein
VESCERFVSHFHFRLLLLPAAAAAALLLLLRFDLLHLCCAVHEMKYNSQSHNISHRLIIAQLNLLLLLALWHPPK